MKRVKRVFLMKEISKKTQTEIRGKDRNGFPIEIKTVDPFRLYHSKNKIEDRTMPITITGGVNI